jgi:primary-amine oxidase
MEPYPFDPLSEEEQAAAVAAVTAVLGPTQVQLYDEWDIVTLKEPPKKLMLAFINGTGPRPPRQAEVTFYYGRSDEYIEFIVHLPFGGTATVVKRTVQKYARPPYSCFSDKMTTDLIKADPRFKNAMYRRGISDYDMDNNIYYDISPDSRLDDLRNCIDCQGPYAALKYCPRPRVFALSPYWNDGNKDTTSAYIQPIGGIIAWVDRRTNTVIDVYDGDVYPLIKGTLDWDRGTRGTLNPMIISDPNPSFTFTPGDEYQVSWEGWQFRYAPDTTFGLILREISVLDRTVNYSNPVRRNVAYRINLTDDITGYASNDIPSKARNFLDVREFPSRDYMSPLQPGIDVPPYATLKNATFTYADGTQFTVENAIAFYEQDGGLSWRHSDYTCSSWGIRGRRNRQLVVAYVSAVGNYDFARYFIFNQDGSIEFQNKLTGVLECDASYKDHVQETLQAHAESGTLLHSYLEAPNHWHAFCLRIDPDIDGVNNTVLEADVVLDPVSEENPCGNIFREYNTILETEKTAQRDHDFNKARKWIVANQSSRTELGHIRSYELCPYPMARPFSNPKSRIGKRALYLQHNLFVTKYRDDEFYAMGKYPVEKPRDQGLSKYICNDEKIVNTDVVLWYVSGLAHPPTVEQYPVMIADTLSVKFAPHNFFSENPMLDVDPDRIVDCPPCIPDAK